MPRYTIGVDIGGTFTDVVVLADDGAVHATKASTIPDDFSLGVIEGLELAASELGLLLPALLGSTDVVKHGSTVATNALITRTGTRVALITTHGFEDTPLIMRAVGRVDGLPEEEVRAITTVTKPEPLVPTERIRGVRERIDAFGNVVVPLNEADVIAAVDELVGRERVEALAISLLHAWRNPTHEARVRELAVERFPDLFLSVGAELSGLAGEYARTNTAIANAYVGPAVSRYLARLERRLRELGFGGTVLAMQGNAGLAAHRRAAPISTLQSGPAGGMLASAYMAERLGHTRAITTDMGGTSFDVGTIDGGYWHYADEPIFERFRILQPIADVRSIGAGGGTIARVEPTTRRLIVGPASAGAFPGPVCYGLGGSEPTVTDADLVLGYLDPGFFLGGRRELDVRAAREAIRGRIADPLGLDVMEAAAGIARIVDAKMADLIRREVVRSGRRPEDFVLYVFGGAGPVHAVGYAREVGVREILVFPSSPVFSAFGIACADIIHTRLVTRATALPADPADLNADLDALEADLQAELQGVATAAEAAFRRYVTLRFRRQTTGEEIPLPWARFTEERVAELARLFVSHYEAQYGAGVAHAEAGIELSGVRVDLVAPVPKPELHPVGGEAIDVRSDQKGERDAWFGGRPLRTAVYGYERLGPDARLKGPAIVESPITTVVLPPGASLTVDAYRNLVIRP